MVDKYMNERCVKCADCNAYDSLSSISFDIFQIVHFVMIFLDMHHYLQLISYDGYIIILTEILLSSIGFLYAIPTCS